MKPETHDTLIAIGYLVIAMVLCFVVITVATAQTVAPTWQPTLTPSKEQCFPLHAMQPATCTAWGDFAGSRDCTQNPRYAFVRLGGFGSWNDCATVRDALAQDFRQWKLICTAAPMYSDMCR